MAGVSYSVIKDHGQIKMAYSNRDIDTRSVPNLDYCSPNRLIYPSRVNMANPDMLTAIIEAYYRPAPLREAVSGLQIQTFENLEIILVDDGATPETVECLHEVAASGSRVKVIPFRENPYSPDDPLKMLDACMNGALRQATGEYVFYQADDDQIADDFADARVQLTHLQPAGAGQ